MAIRVSRGCILVLQLVCLNSMNLVRHGLILYGNMMCSDASLEKVTFVRNERLEVVSLFAKG